MGKKKKSYRLLVGTPEGMRPQGNLRRRWVDNISMGGDIDATDTSPTSLIVLL
jgi:hypothetical protein